MQNKYNLRTSQDFGPQKLDKRYAERINTNDEKVWGKTQEISCGHIDIQVNIHESWTLFKILNTLLHRLFMKQKLLVDKTCKKCFASDGQNCFLCKTNSIITLFFGIMTAYEGKKIMLGNDWNDDIMCLYGKNKTGYSSSHLAKH